ncbi:MAG: 3-dehydroquinate synthase [Candidatus Faecousia sp.]|nr:3-dehydroquinate synthase [Candidatus Faecousia sp.]
MNTVTVSASKTYDILIGSGLLPSLGAEVKKLGKAQKVCVVSESNVFPLYGQTVVTSLESAGFSVVRYVFSAGEESKNGSVFLDLLNFLAQNGLTRSDMIVALGGGVTGDLAGFAAASFLRGIRFVQVPTTLLAAVDSSVGGKTAIDLPAGKNLAGAFYQPDLVACDTDALSALPRFEYENGMAEVIKYGLLSDAELFSRLESPSGISMGEMIARCVSIKRDLVNRDERDVGDRQLLNLGHTFGHGIEKDSGYSIPHGRAVAAGMGIMARACAAKGLCPQDVPVLLAKMLDRYNLPCDTGYDPDALFAATLSDKKRASGGITLVVIREIGRCELMKVSLDEAREFLRLGLCPEANA